MQWLLLFLGGLLEKLLDWFMKKGIFAIGTTVSFATYYIGLYIAFIVATSAIFWAFEPLVPPGVSFVLSFFPPICFAMFNAYFTALVARRIFDWHRRVVKEMHQAMNSMNY